MTLRRTRKEPVTNAFADAALKKLRRGDNAPFFKACNDDLAAFLSHPNAERAPLDVQSHAVVEALIRNGKTPLNKPLSTVATDFLALSNNQNRTRQGEFGLSLARSLHLRVKDFPEDQRKMVAEKFKEALEASKAPRSIVRATLESIYI